MKHNPDFMEKFTRDLEARRAAAIILEVDALAGAEELKKAYRTAASRHHPDHNGNTPEANKRFVLVKCAYELLAFDKPSDGLLHEIDTWPGIPEDDTYKLDNPWGHFLWWRDKFFDSNEKKEKHGKTDSCI